MQCAPAAFVGLIAVHSGPSLAKERATFLKGQFATEANCEKLRKIEAGGPRNVETAPELLDASGFHGWEGGCEFTTVFEHDAGTSWVGLMVCFEGPTAAPQTYLFTRSESDDSFEVTYQGQDQAELYVRCDAQKGH